MKKLKLKYNQILTKKYYISLQLLSMLPKIFKSQIIKSKSYMAGITQNKQMPYFHCGNKSKNAKKELVKASKRVKQLVNLNNIN